MASILGVISPKIKITIVKPTVVIIGAISALNNSVNKMVEIVVAEILTILLPTRRHDKTWSYLLVNLSTNLADFFDSAIFFKRTLFTAVKAVSGT